MLLKITGEISPDSPTQKIRYEVVSELKKVSHDEDFPMLSLDKTKSVEAHADCLGDKEGLLSWKLDGLTVVLTYNDGELKKAVTRGNGVIGELVTNNAKMFKNLPLNVLPVIYGTIIPATAAFPVYTGSRHKVKTLYLFSRPQIMKHIYNCRSNFFSVIVNGGNLRFKK